MTRRFYHEVARLAAVGFGALLLTYSLTAEGESAVKWIEGTIGAALIMGSLAWAVVEKASEN